MDENFDDVVPMLLVEPVDGGASSINYPPQYERSLNIFRAIQQQQELSSRVLELTMDILTMNPGHYTVWQYRRQCLFGLKENLQEELDFIDHFSDDNPKNYQLWYHRRAVVDAVGNGDREIVFADKVLRLDAKNYHCWAHRQWAVLRFDMFAGEMEATERYINLDIRNNSAWNHRWFVVHNGGRSTLGNEIHVPTTTTATVVSSITTLPVVPAVALLSTTSTLRHELLFVFRQLLKVSLNESSWNYLRGLYEKYKSVVVIAGAGAGAGSDSTRGGNEDDVEVERVVSGDVDVGTIVLRIVEKLRPRGASYNNGKARHENSFALSLYVDILINQLQEPQQPQREQVVQDALSALDSLLLVDPIRHKYWNSLKQQVHPL